MNTRIFFLALPVLWTVSLPMAYGESAADALVAGKQRADMTYRELMQILGRSLGWMQSGIVLENKQLVREAANHVQHHPAPRHKPWLIMDPLDQEGFKQALLAFDAMLDRGAGEVTAAVEQGDWIGATEAMARLQTTCVSCHMQWRGKARADARSN
jgi:hypothetical protein